MNKRNYNKMFNEKVEEEKLSEREKKVDQNSMPYKSYNEVQDSPASAPTEPKTATVISRGKLNVRKTPSKDGELVCQINPGDKLQIEEKVDDWAHIYTSSGIEGYVMVEFIKEV